MYKTYQQLSTYRTLQINGNIPINSGENMNRVCIIVQRLKCLHKKKKKIEDYD
jgi:hypothetical protein